MANIPVSICHLANTEIQQQKSLLYGIFIFQLEDKKSALTLISD